ncbi:MAG: DUF167 domain-containing protein [Burkholderiales bacterium]
MPRDASWYRYDPKRDILTLSLHIQPSARRSEFAGRYGASLKLRIRAPAVDHKANSLLIDFLRNKLDLPARSVMITKGQYGRAKTIEIAGPSADLLARISKLADE